MHTLSILTTHLSNSTLKLEYMSNLSEKVLHPKTCPCSTTKHPTVHNSTEVLASMCFTGSVILFDLETSGLPDIQNPKLKFGEFPLYTSTSKYDSARIVQIAYMVCDKDLNMLSIHQSIINSHGLFKINFSEIHHITDEVSTSHGRDLDLVLSEFMAVLTEADTLVAHNAAFDVNVLKAELHRSGNNVMLHELNRKQVVDTMQECMVVVNARRCWNDQQVLKPPKLAELYQFATAKVMQDAHDAEHDVRNMHEALKIMLDKGQFQLPTL